MHEIWRKGEGESLGGLVVNEEALSFCKQAIVIARENKDRRAESRHLGSIGSAYGNIGQHDKTISFDEEEALVIAREINNRASEGLLLGNLGVAHDNLGQYEWAISYHEQSITIKNLIWNDISQDESRVAFDDTTNSPYASLESLFLRNREFGRALEISEQFRSQNLNLLLVEQQQQKKKTRICAHWQNNEEVIIDIEDIEQIALDNNSIIIVYFTQNRDSLMYIWVIDGSKEEPIVAKSINISDDSNDKGKSIKQENIKSIVSLTQDFIEVRSLHRSSSSSPSNEEEKRRSTNVIRPRRDHAVPMRMQEVVISSNFINYWLIPSKMT